MPESATWEEAVGLEQPQEASWEDVQPEPDLTKIKISPYEQADIASFARGLGKPQSGMEPGTELTAALAQGIPEGITKATELIGKGVLQVANLPTRLANLSRGAMPDTPGYVLPLEELPRPQLPTLAPEEVPTTQPWLQTLAGLGNIVSRNLQGLLPVFAPPEVGLTLPLLAGEGAIAKLGLSTYGAGALASLPNAVAEASRALEDQSVPLMEKIAATAQVPITAAFGAAMLRGGLRTKGIPDATQERILREDIQAERPRDDALGAPAETGVGRGVPPEASFEQAALPQEGQPGVLLANQPAVKLMPLEEGAKPEYEPAQRKPNGEWETHDEVIKRAGLRTEDVDRRVFLDETGKEKSREQTSAELTQAGIESKVPGEAHSTDVNKALTQQPQAPGFTGEPMAEVDIWNHLKEKHGIKKGGVVKPYYDATVRESGEILYDKQRKPIGIRINQAFIHSKAKLDWVIEHEASHWFDLENPDITLRLQGQMPMEEYQAVRSQIDALKYGPEEITAEVTARSIQKLADGWRQRGWFDKVVGTVQRFASEKLGMKLTRRAAENTAARAITQSIKKISRAKPVKADVSAGVKAWQKVMAGRGQRARSLEAQTALPEAEDIFKVSDAELGSVLGPRGGQGDALTAKLASEMTEPQLKRAEPIIADYLKKHAEAKDLLTQGKIDVQEYVNRVMQKGTKGKVFADVFARLNRPLKPAASNLPEVKPGMVRTYSGGRGSSWYTTKLERAQSFAQESGGVLNWVDVPKDVFDAASSDARIGGSFTPGDAFMRNEWVKKSKPVVAGKQEAQPDIGTGFFTKAAAEPAGRLLSREKGTPEMFLPPEARGTKLERGVDIEVPEEARRLKITPLDIEWTQRGKEGAYRPISNAEASNPAALGRILTTDARIEGSELPVSSTRRLVAMVDKSNGEVHIVSVYPHGRAGAMAVNPSKAGSPRPNVPLRDLLERYKPLYSILRDSPVKNFHQKFDGLDDYMQRFGDEAGQRSQESLGQDALAKPVGEPIMQPEYPGGLEDPALPTDAELKAFHNFFEGETPATKLDFDRLMANASNKATREMASAVHKAYLAEAEANPGASPEFNLESALSKLYEDLKNTDTRSGFVQGTQARLRAGLAEPVQEGRLAAQAPAAAPTGARELRLPRFARTSVPRGGIPEAAPIAEPSAMLPPEAQSYVAAEAAKKFAPRWPPTLYRQLAHREVPKAPYRMRGIATVAEEAKARTESEFFGLIGTIRATIARHGTKQDISILVDRAQAKTVIESQKAKRNIQQSSSSTQHPNGDPKVLSAARAAVATSDPADLPKFVKMTQEGQAKALQIIASPTEATMANVGMPEVAGVSRGQILAIGRAWLKSAKELEQEVRFAIENWGNPDLMETALDLRYELDNQLHREQLAGKTVNEVDNYLPGLYEGELYGDNAVTFSNIVLGRAYGKPKTFSNQYEAIAAGPYIPKMNSVADIAAVRIRAGMGSILRDQAFKAALNLEDPVTRSPIAIEAEQSKGGGFQVPGGNLQYRLVYPQGGGKPIAVRRGYAKLMEDLFGRSGLEDWVGGKGLIKLAAIEKHTTLAGDIYHLSKMGWYAMAITRGRTQYKGGYTALEFRPDNMAEAVRRGVISQESMDWALQPFKVTLNGREQILTRQEILGRLVNKGFNVGRIQDAMYKHFVDALDIEIAGRRVGIGSYNRFLFDQFTRGLMANSAVEEFLRQHKAAPNIDANVILKRVARDVNTQFGSSGKQALIKNPTLRDITQLILLAPQWVGTRISTEVRFMSRLATTPYVMATQGKGAAVVHFGSLGRGIGTGMVTMLALTQALNLITRGQWTWQNPENEHKMDAWIPDFQGGPGHWISPLAVFMELTHDVARYMASGEKNLGETIMQIGANKLGPLGRSAATFFGGYTPLGQKITTTRGRFTETAKGLIPVPITAGAPLRELGHAVLPKQVVANRAGALQRQLFASSGVKSEVAQTAVQKTAKMAKDFMEREGLTKDTGWQQVQTDKANYSKLRSAIRNGDFKEAKSNLEELRATRSDKEIADSMKMWKRRGFTTLKIEPQFRNSLTTAELKVYDKAIEEKLGLYEKWLDWFWKQP
jgi:hypothetical protein